MKKVMAALALCLLMVGALAAPAMADTIKDGTILDTADNPITLGVDQFGYNYQAHIFNGPYSSADRSTEPSDPDAAFSNVKLQMKWNDAWLSNQDRDDDGKLDRHYGFATYIGSGAWLTNHDSGVNEEGKRWTYFVKIIAVPADAEKIDGIWYTANDTQIGPDIWGQFAVIQQVVTGNPPANFTSYDQWPSSESFRSPAGCGLGNL